MRTGAPQFRSILFDSLRSSIIVTVLGLIAFLTIMQWTLHTVQKHVRVASESIFPAALDSERAENAFERMNHGYNALILSQNRSAIASEGQQAAAAVSMLDKADAAMQYSSARHQQIDSLELRIAAVQRQSMIYYEAAAVPNRTQPQQQDLAALSLENKDILAALEDLQSSLASDFRAELAFIDELQKLQELLDGVVLAGMIVALIFGIRSLIDVTVQRQGDEISRRVQSAQVTEHSLLRAVIDNIPDFIYAKDAESRFLLANSYLANVVGVKTPEELLGKTDFDFYPREMAEAFSQDEQRVMLSGQPLHNREEKGIDSEGNETRVLTTKVPLRDESGRVIGIAGMGRDITALKKVEDALREAEQNYRGIFDKAVVGMFQSTPEGRFLAVNPSMAFSFGYNSPEEMAASITDIPKQFFVKQKRGVEFMLVMDRVGGVKNFECEAYCKDRSKIWVAMSIRAIRQCGVVVRYEGMCEDCTERNVLRTQLLQAQKLESIGQLAAGIAHEINTPTQYIGDNVRFLQEAFSDLHRLLLSYSELLSAAESGALSKELIQETAVAAERSDVVYLVQEIPKSIEQALEGIVRVSTLVNAMKEFSHPGMQEKVLLDLNHAIENTIAVSRNEWKYTADLETELDTSLPPVPCLPGAINQAILNLIVNAAHAISESTQQGGPRMGLIKIQTRSLRGWAQIRIQDTGCGIPDAIRSRIFDPFFTTKEVGKGTGQGLAIARSIIVDKHHGSIDFETEIGKGTTFIVNLPFERQSSVAQAVTK